MVVGQDYQSCRLGPNLFWSDPTKKKRKKDICWAKIDPTILGRDRPNPTCLGLTQLGGPT